MPTVIDQAGIPYSGETIRLDGNLYARLAADGTLVLGSRSLTGVDSTLNLDAIAGTLDAAKLYGNAALADVSTNTAVVLAGIRAGEVGVFEDADPDFGSPQPTISFSGGASRLQFGPGGSSALDTAVGRTGSGAFGGLLGTTIAADTVGGYAASGLGRLDSAGTWALSQIFSAAAWFQSPTVPFVVMGTDRVDNLTAHYLGAVSQDATFFRNAGNLNAGNVPYARLPNAGGTWDAASGTVDLTGAFRTSMALTARVATTGTAALIARTAAATMAEFVVYPNRIEIGDGTATRDCVQERLSAGIMQFTNTRVQVRQAAATTAAFSASTGGANAEFLFFVNGNFEWGRSGGARDTRFRCPAAGELTIDNPSGGAARLSIGGVGSWGSGVGAAVFLLNTTTAPSANPTGGGILYVEAGALKYRGTSGTVTTLGNA
jgi:hypothetical protein